MPSKKKKASEVWNKVMEAWVEAVKDDNRAQNRHDTLKHKKKKHPASKCGNAKCLICHSDKILNIPDRQTMRADEILKQIDKQP